jgi:hypothetical protein
MAAFQALPMSLPDAHVPCAMQEQRGGSTVLPSTWASKLASILPDGRPSWLLFLLEWPLSWLVGFPSRRREYLEGPQISNYWL